MNTKSKWQEEKNSYLSERNLGTTGKIGPPIYLGDGTMKVTLWRRLPKELEDDDQY